MDTYSPLINQVYSAVQMRKPMENQENDRPLLEILDSASIGAWVIDVESERVVFSDQWMDRMNLWGCTEAEQIEKTVRAVHPDDRERVIQYFTDGLMRGFPPCGIEFRVNAADRQIWVFSKGRMTYDEDGNPAKYYNTCLDITDRKEYERQLKENARIITNFFRNISHEFRTPLSIILLYVDLMNVHLRQAECAYREKIDSSTAVLRQNAYRLLRLTSNLLDITSMDAGLLGVHPAPCDIVGKAREVAGAVAAISGKTGIVIEFTSDLESRTMPVDVEKLERVMLNLISNALKHTNRGGRIAMGVSNDDAGATLWVRDYGEGIPPDKQDCLFRLFSQVNSSLTRANEGVGVGLALTKGFVELLGGTIWFESRCGDGCTFFVRLPSGPSHPAEHQPETNPIPLNKRIEMEFSDITYGY